MKARNKQILSLAIPSIVSNITVPLLGLVDLSIVGHMGSAAYIGAIAVGTMIFNVIYWIFGFLRMGTSGMTAQAFGQRNFAETARLLVRSMSVGMVIAACFLLFQSPLRWLAISVMHPSEEMLPHVTAYFNICIWGAPAMLCLYGLSGWFIGMQNTRFPMIVSIAQNVINIAASVVLVYGFKMQVEGVAMGTLIAQWSGWLLAMWLCIRYYGRLKEHVDGDWQLTTYEPFAKFFTVNRDIFLRTLFLVAVFLSFTAIGVRQGDVLLSVNTLLMTFFTMFSHVMDGFAFAAEAMCGRYYGAADKHAFDDTCRKVFMWGAAIVAVFTVVYLFGGKYFIYLLTSNPDVRQAANGYIGWIVAVPIVGVAAFIYDGIFVGISATRGMLVSSLIASVTFFAVFFLLKDSLQNHALWLAFIVYMFMRGFVQHIYMLKRLSL